MAHSYRAGETSGRVLLADDEDLVRRTVRLILKAHGYQVVEASDGEEAVQKYRDAVEPFDVVLLDLDMPGLGGAEALRKIKHYHHDAKAIFLTGGGVPPPDCPCLEKPFDNQELIRMVREMVGKT